MQDVEDLLFLNTELLAAPIVMAIKLMSTATGRTVGVAFADASIRQLGVSEFADNDLFSNTESLVIQLGVRECVVQADEKKSDFELGKLKELLERCGVVVTDRKAGSYPSALIGSPSIDALDRRICFEECGTGSRATSQGGVIFQHPTYVAV